MVISGELDADALAQFGHGVRVAPTIPASCDVAVGCCRMSLRRYGCIANVPAGNPYRWARLSSYGYVRLPKPQRGAPTLLQLAGKSCRIGRTQ